MLGVFHDNNCLAIRCRDGATVERNVFEGKSILIGLRWDSVAENPASIRRPTGIRLSDMAGSYTDTSGTTNTKTFRGYLAFQHPSECQSCALQGPGPAG